MDVIDHSMYCKVYLTKTARAVHVAAHLAVHLAAHLASQVAHNVDTVDKVKVRL